MVVKGAPRRRIVIPTNRGDVTIKSSKIRTFGGRTYGSSLAKTQSGTRAGVGTGRGARLVAVDNRPVSGASDATKNALPPSVGTLLSGVQSGDARRNAAGKVTGSAGIQKLSIGMSAGFSRKVAELGREQTAGLQAIKSGGFEFSGLPTQTQLVLRQKPTRDDRRQAQERRQQRTQNVVAKHFSTSPVSQLLNKEIKTHNIQVLATDNASAGFQRLAQQKAAKQRFQSTYTRTQPKPSPPKDKAILVPGLLALEQYATPQLESVSRRNRPRGETFKSGTAQLTYTGAQLGLAGISAASMAYGTAKSFVLAPYYLTKGGIDLGTWAIRSDSRRKDVAQTVANLRSQGNLAVYNLNREIRTSPGSVVGKAVGVGVGFVGGTKATQLLSDAVKFGRGFATVKLNRASYVAPETVFSEQALSQGTGLATGYSPKRTVEVLSKGLAKDEVVFSHVTPSGGLYKSGQIKTGVRKEVKGKDVKLEDPGAYISGKGEAQPLFTYVGKKPEGYSLTLNPFKGLFPDIPQVVDLVFKKGAATVQKFPLAQAKRAADVFAKAYKAKGYEAAKEAYIRYLQNVHSAANSRGIVYTSMRNALQTQRVRRAINPIANKFLKATSEAEGIIARGRFVREGGRQAYTKYKGFFIPVRRLLSTDTPISGSVNLGTSASKGGRVASKARQTASKVAQKLDVSYSGRVQQVTPYPYLTAVLRNVKVSSADRTAVVNALRQTPKPVQAQYRSAAKAYRSAVRLRKGVVVASRRLQRAERRVVSSVRQQWNKLKPSTVSRRMSAVKSYLGSVRSSLRSSGGSLTSGSSGDRGGGSGSRIPPYRPSGGGSGSSDGGSRRPPYRPPSAPPYGGSTYRPSVTYGLLRRPGSPATVPVPLLPRGRDRVRRRRVKVTKKPKFVLPTVSEFFRRGVPRGKPFQKTFSGLELARFST